MIGTLEAVIPQRPRELDGFLARPEDDLTCEVWFCADLRQIIGDLKTEPDSFGFRCAAQRVRPIMEEAINGYGWTLRNPMKKQEILSPVLSERS